MKSIYPETLSASLPRDALAHVLPRRALVGLFGLPHDPLAAAAIALVSPYAGAISLVARFPDLISTLKGLTN